MKPSLVNDLNEIAEEIKQRIQAYADKHGISFEEAKKRARITIDGISTPLGESDERD